MDNTFDVCKNCEVCSKRFVKCSSPSASYECLWCKENISNTFSAKEFDKSLDFGPEGKKPGGFAPDLESNWDKRKTFNPNNQQSLEKGSPRLPNESWTQSVDERIAWNSAVNNACHLHEYDSCLSPDDIENIKTDARSIYKLIKEGPNN